MGKTHTDGPMTSTSIKKTHWRIINQYNDMSEKKNARQTLKRLLKSARYNFMESVLLLPNNFHKRKKWFNKQINKINNKQIYSLKNTVYLKLDY